MNLSTLTSKIERVAQTEGAALVGFAPVGRYDKLPVQCGNKPEDVLPGAKSVVSFAVQMPDACMERACFHDYGDPEAGFVNVLVSLRLNLIAARIAELLEQNGHAAVPIAATVVWRYRPYKNTPTPFIGDISHRHIAAGAGLGEFGWNGLLLTKDYGPRVRLGTVITTATLEASPMYSGSKLCDKCMRCVRECGKNIQGLTKEVNGKVELEIGGKWFEYANKNLWRCAWTENFALKFDAPKPAVISEQSMQEVFRDVNKKKLDWWRTWTIEPCWGHCLPPDIRYDDPDYCKVPRRRKVLMMKGMVEADVLKKITADVESIVARKLHDSTVKIIDLRQNQGLREKLAHYLPDISSLILVKERIPAGFRDLLKVVWHDVIGIELDLITRLDRLGYNALQFSFLRERDNQVLVKEIFESSGILDRKTATLDKQEKKLYEGILTSTSFVEGDECRIAVIGSSAALAAITFDVRNKAKVKMTGGTATCAATVKKIASALGADFIGIASRERIDELHKQLVATYCNEIRFEAQDLNSGKGPFIPSVEERKTLVKPLSDYLKEASSVIVIGKKLSSDIIDQHYNTPSEVLGPYATHRTFSLDLLADTALRLCRQLVNSGFDAVPVYDLFGLASLFPYPIREYNVDTYASRFASVAAGLGELGQHGMVLTPGNGVRQIFMAIVTSAKLSADPLYQGPPLCKKCGACSSACPVKAISPDEQVGVTVEGKTFSFGKFRQAHCDWSKRYSLIGDEGPRYIGSTTDIKPPSIITKENLGQALSQIDEIQKDYFVVMEPCLVACKAHGGK